MLGGEGRGPLQTWSRERDSEGGPRTSIEPKRHEQAKYAIARRLA